MKNQIADFPFPPTTHTLREFSYTSKRYEKIEEKSLTKLDLALLEVIPYWPETILKSDLQKMFNIKNSVLNCHLDSIQFIGKVFDDFETHSVSRLKEDLSNVDLT